MQFTRAGMITVFIVTLLQTAILLVYISECAVRNKLQSTKLGSVNSTEAFVNKSKTFASLIFKNSTVGKAQYVRKVNQTERLRNDTSRHENRTLAGTKQALAPLNFEESMKRVQDEMRDTIFRFDRALKLPLMKLTAAQQNKTYRITEARKWLKSQRLVVAVSVRNAIYGLESSVRVLRQLSDLFQSVTAVFVENDSTDKTRSFLHGLTKQSNDKFRVFLLGCGKVNSPDPCHVKISYGSSGRQHKQGHWEQAKRNLAEESTDRGLVMAALRNIYLQFIYDRIDTDLMLVLESDLQWRNWDLDSVAQGLFHFKSKQQLDSLCAVNIYNNYLLHDPCTLIFFDNKHFYVDSGETDGPFIDRLGKKNKLFEKHLNIPHSKPQDVPAQPVKVASCFQGAAFYRMSSLRAASAFYRYSEGEWHCEHSTLSKQLRENYLDTQMLLGFAGHSSG